MWKKEGSTFFQKINFVVSEYRFGAGNRKITTKRLNFQAFFWRWKEGWRVGKNEKEARSSAIIFKRITTSDENRKYGKKLVEEKKWRTIQKV